MSVHKEDIFIRNKKRDQILKSFFCEWERPKDDILDLKKSGAFSKDNYIATSFVYVAETNNHRLIKIGITSNPFGRLSYQLVAKRHCLIFGTISAAIAVLGVRN